MSIISKITPPPAAVVQEIMTYIAELTNYFSTPVPFPIVVGIVQTESSFDPMAYHWNTTNTADRSFGLMQLTWPTAQWLAANNDQQLASDGRDLYDPVMNLFLGMSYLEYLYNQYGDWGDVISAFNMGSPQVTSSGEYVNAAYVNNVVNNGQNMTGQTVEV